MKTTIIRIAMSAFCMATAMIKSADGAGAQDSARSSRSRR